MGQKIMGLLTSADKEIGLFFSAGISENPLDGVNADDLIVKAQHRTKMAQKDKKLYEAFA